MVYLGNTGVGHSFDTVLDAADRQLATYSKGMLQRIGLAQALLNRPALVFLAGMGSTSASPVGRLNSHRIRQLKCGSSRAAGFSAASLRPARTSDGVCAGACRTCAATSSFYSSSSLWSPSFV